MLTFKSNKRPDWAWLPPTQESQIYTWSLFRLEEERYWQIAWSEYKRRRLTCEKSYKAQAIDTEAWKKIGKELFTSMTDPQLFIEQLFLYFLSLDRPRPPLIAEILPKFETLGLWYNEKYTPDAEGDFIIAGTNMESLIQRFPDTSIDYWLDEKSDEFPPYFHLLFRSSGELPKGIAEKGARQVIQLPILRTLELFQVWPNDAHLRLMNARREHI